MSARGFTLLEVLITLIILAIGMLGLANLQSKIHTTEIESYQRAQAVLLLQDMVDRINTNRSSDALEVDPLKPGGYVSDVELGTDTDEDCAAATLAAINPATRRLAASDRCQWSNLLLGTSETKGATNVGAMIGARGCIEEIQAPDAAVGVCRPGIYRITIAWQGLHATKAPELACGKDQYGGAANDAQRRAIATRITIGLPRCASV